MLHLTHLNNSKPYLVLNFNWTVLCKISVEYNRIVAQSLKQVHLMETLCISIKHSKVAYTKYINQTVQFSIPQVEKWKLELDDPLLDQNVISSSLMKLYAATVSTKIQSFQ